MRGVYRTPSRPSQRARGSSPLARGLPPGLTLTSDGMRIIPACAGFTRGGRYPHRPARDHPRLRGVYAREHARGARADGSSPLARGLLHRARTGLPAGRIIPACAGFTDPRSRRRPAGRDHPRLRGVYLSAHGVPPRRRGSSPLARGLLGPGRWRGRGARIIPACAGFTPSPPRPRPSCGDHPRLRGVYAVTTPSGYQPGGSSPLARGLPGVARRRLPGPGIIPACAGFTLGALGAMGGFRDHPRLRGVYATHWVAGPGVRGSSPLARGLLSASVIVVISVRIIPACAGFTCRCQKFVCTGLDHPRLRGVYGRSPRPEQWIMGSSPLARGLPPGQWWPPGRPRIIPACAGFTPSRTGDSHGPRDHPRLRGVYCQPRFFSFRAAGSSPLARGLRRHLSHLRDSRRIIPACAGFTSQR